MGSYLAKIGSFRKTDLIQNEVNIIPLVPREDFNDEANIDRETETTQLDIKEENESFEILSDAIKWLHDFADERDYKPSNNVQVMKIEIEEIFSNLNIRELEILAQKYNKKSIVILITSTTDKKIQLSWKWDELHFFVTLKPYDSLLMASNMQLFNYIVEFLSNSLSHGYIGIRDGNFIDVLTLETELHFLQDHRGYDIMMRAVEVKNNCIVDLLLKLHVPNQLNVTKAQSIAYKNGYMDILLLFLESNSTYPDEMDLNKCSYKIKEFKNICDDLHKYIKEKNSKKVEEIINKKKNLRYFYNTKNESAATLAIIFNRIDIYEILFKNGVCFGPYEDIENTIKELKVQNKRAVRNIHQNYAKSIPDKCINILLANSHILYNDDATKFKLIRNAFTTLNEIPLITTIFKTVAASQVFTIIFDFNSDNVMVTDPTRDKSTQAICYFSGRIFIGARDLLNVDTRNNVLGLIAHELCHYAISLTYKNNGRPYSENNSFWVKLMFRYTRIMCKIKSRNEEIVSGVFNNYKKSLHDTELAVRVPHLLALYHDDEVKIEKSRKNFKLLFDDIEGRVIPDMVKKIPEIETEARKHKNEKYSKMAFNSNGYYNKSKTNCSLLLWLLLGLISFVFIFFIFFIPEMKINKELEKVENMKNAMTNAVIDIKSCEKNFAIAKSTINEVYSKIKEADEQLTTLIISSQNALDTLILVNANLLDIKKYYLEKLKKKESSKMIENLETSGNIAHHLKRKVRDVQNGRDGNASSMNVEESEMTAKDLEAQIKEIDEILSETDKHITNSFIGKTIINEYKQSVMAEQGAINLVSNGFKNDQIYKKEALDFILKTQEIIDNVLNKTLSLQQEYYNSWYISDFDDKLTAIQYKIQTAQNESSECTQKAHDVKLKSEIVANNSQHVSESLAQVLSTFEKVKNVSEAISHNTQKIHQTAELKIQKTQNEIDTFKSQLKSLKIQHESIQNMLNDTERTLKALEQQKVKAINDLSNLKQQFQSIENGKMINKTETLDEPEQSEDEEWNEHEDIQELFNKYLTDNKNCGKIDGERLYNKSAKTFPWAAGLMNRNRLICGGTLLTKNEVLTAAHCIHGKDNQYKFSPGDITVVLRAFNFSNENENGRRSFAVDSIVIHENWNITATSYDADIAILTLNQNVVFNVLIHPICLMYPKLNIANPSTGYLVNNIKKANVNQSKTNIIKLFIVSDNEDCFLSDHNLAQFSSKRTFCGGSRNGSGVCVGDSGNGLFVVHENTFYIRGIVSASLSDPDGCNTHNFAVFTNVLKFYIWIMEKIEKRFVTVWIPNKVYSEKDYRFIILPSNINQRTEFSLNIRTSYGTIPLYSNKMQRVKLINRHETGARNEFELKMILHQNETTSAGTRQLCITRSLSIAAEKRDFYTFIQTDKPIYKPGDSVRFRVVVVNRDLTPYHMSNIKINVTDSLNRPVKEFDDLTNSILGVFTGNFILSQNTPLGIWKIEVVVDLNHQFKRTKEFSVQKYTQSYFSAHMTANDKHLLITDGLHLSFYAKYSFGDFVRGNAEVRIKSINSGQIVAKRSFRNISDVKNVQFNIWDDLKATTTTKQDYEAELVFAEPESGVSEKTSVRLTVHPDSSPQIQANHPEKFTPGHPFGIKVFVYDWKNEAITNSLEDVKILLESHHQSGSRTVIYKDVRIKDGIATYSFDLPVDTYELDVKVYYLNAIYEKKIEKGSEIIRVNNLIVDHFPKRPNFGDNINITVKDVDDIDQILAVVMTRNGIKESRKINCDFQKTCEFSIYMTKSMMPSTKVVVYYVKDKDNILQGETVIDSEQLGYNTLNISMPISSHSRKNVSMEISTEPKSKVFLLGIEKNPTYPFSGNEILKENVINEMSDFDRTHRVTVIQIKKNNWHECTEKEVRMIAFGRRPTVAHGGDEYIGNKEEDEEEVEDLELDLESYYNEHNIPETESDVIRDDFREVWLFEELDVPDGSITKQFITLDSMTSWIISSFSMNDEYGLAIGSPKEITVKNQFFIKVLLPYSIRYKEPLRVDILVHNYVDTSESLNVTVSISGSNDFIRFYENKCSKIPIVDKKLTKSVTVPQNNVKRVSFYLHAGNDRQEILEHAELKIDTIAQAENGDIFNDKVFKKLKVERPEVKVYDIQIKNYNLKSTDSVEHYLIIFEKYPKLSVEISGDYLGDELKNVNLGYEISNSDPLMRRIEKLKENVEHFRYLKSKSQNPQTANFNDHYRSIFERGTNLHCLRKSTEKYFKIILTFVWALDTMNRVLLFLVILSANFVDSSDEYVTIWTPSVINSGQDYNVAFLSSGIDKRTQISLKLCNSYATMTLASEKLQQFTFRSNQQTSGAKNAHIHVTIHRNETNSNGTRQMCMSQTINDVKVAKKQFHTFIQTDKPIYKPGDEVRFRIIIVDKNLMPHNPNNFQIKIIDPQGRTIREINETGENLKTVYTGSFILSIDTPLGVWKITTVIDKHHQWMTSKKFGVTRFILPTFNAYITVKSSHLLTNSVLQLGFYAKYPFEDFVRGNAQLKITCTTNNQIVLTKSFTDITGIHNVKYKVHDDLKANTTTRLDYEAMIVFTEPQSGISANKTFKFTVHADNSPRIKPNHPEKFMPGLPFGIKVFVFDWRDELIKKSPERVKVSLDCVLQNGEERTLIVDGVIKQGVAISNVIIPEDADSLTVRIKYLQVTYQQKIEKGLVVVGVNKIMVEYTPKNPKYGDAIKVHVRADFELDQLIAVVMSRHGNIESHQVNCNYHLTCPFNIIIRKNMMPEAKIVVYHVKDKQSIHQGEVTIRTAELGKNTLDIEIPNYVERRKKIDIKINTQPESTVYLLGFDKRLSSFFQGNEITKDDVVSELADYDGNNKITVFHMKKTMWHECDDKELIQIEKGRRYIIDHSRDYEALEYEDEIVCHEDNNFEELPTSDNTESIGLQDIEEDFRNVWIFEELKSIQMYEVPWTFEVSWMYGVPRMNRVPDERFIKSIYVPSSTNTWMISSFSIHDEYGLAIGAPRELVVKTQFYIQAISPYIIKFGEIIKVDVMVYNYVDNREALDVKITMFNSEKLNTFKFYDSECSLTPSNETKPSKTIRVPNENARKVSFYIQPTSSKQNFEERIKIRIDAIATSRYGERFEDKMIKSLRVEPVGVKTFNVISENYNLAKNSKEIVHYIENDLVNKDEHKRYITEVAGDYLTEYDMLRNLGHYMYPSYSLEQKTSQLREGIEIFRYLKEKNLNPSTKDFSEIYQSILGQWNKDWSYKNTTSFIAYFVDTIASAMETGVIPKDIAIITNGLDSLKASQIINGSFDNFGNFLEFQGDSGSAQYFQTAFILIPFLNFRRFTTKNYDAVIDKGLNFLNAIKNLESLDKEALSVAAYVYALNNDKNQTQVLLNEVEKSAIQIDGNEKCYKLSENHTNCDLRHTAYAALAFMTADQVDNAKYIVKYIMSKFKSRSYHGSNFNYILSTEVISKYLIAKKFNTTTDFKVTFTSERGLESILNLTNSNQNILHQFTFPDYTLHPKMTINGTGVCSIRKIIESYSAVEQESSKFNVTVTPQPVINQNERIVRVCATYHPQENSNRSESLFSVIYDVEMPSGYFYKEIVDYGEQKDIKLAAPKLARPRVQIYYSDFKQGINYCVDIRAIKLWKLRNMQNAGVKVFDHNDYENAAISFYTFSSDDCEPPTQVYNNDTTEANRVDQVTSLWNSTNPLNVNSTKTTEK